MKKSAENIPISSLWKGLQSLIKSPIVQKVAGVVFSWFGKRIVQSIIEKNEIKVSYLNSNSLNTKTMEVGIFTKRVISALAVVLDGLIAFKNILLESADGMLWSLILNGLNKNVADKIPEPLKTELRDMIDALYAERDVAKGALMAAEIYQRLVKLPFEHSEENEKQAFLAIAQLGLGYLVNLFPPAK